MSVTIFEGPDGAGKTVLADTLERMMPRREQREAVRRNNGPYIGEASIAEHYLTQMVQTRLGHYHVIMDRAWLSESIYGPLMRDKNRINVAQRRALERFALGCGAIVVLCLPSYSACEYAYMKRRGLEYLPDPESLMAVWKAFHALTGDIDQHTVPTFLYDYEKEDSRTLYLDMLYEIRGAFVNKGPGVGAYKKGVTLMIGEQVSQQTAAALFPFISWDPRGCAAWLSDQLEEWQVSERDLYWVNALDLRGHELAPGRWLEELQPSRVVALGQVAGAWMHKHKRVLKGAELHDVPHPQHWKRFHHNEPYMLKEVFQK